MFSTVMPVLESRGPNAEQVGDVELYNSWI